LPRGFERDVGQHAIERPDEGSGAGGEVDRHEGRGYGAGSAGRPVHDAGRGVFREPVTAKPMAPIVVMCLPGGLEEEWPPLKISWSGPGWNERV
jgi:hypothetical protein